MKTVAKTSRAILKVTKTWGWHVVEKHGNHDGRDLERSFGKGEKGEKEARLFFYTLNNCEKSTLIIKSEGHK